MMTLSHLRTNRAEVWNTISHGMGLVFALMGGSYLLYIALSEQVLPDIVAVLFYFLGAAFVYGSSTAYHAAHPGNLKERLKQVDHISIYFMIAGTHMPIILRYFNNTEGYIFLTVMWSLVLLGTIYKIFWMERFEILSLILYVLMGGMSAVLFPSLLEMMSPWVLALIIVGSSLYLVGIIFYLWESLPFHHLIWHLFVLAGSVVHFIAIYTIIGS